jgi:hypothetical protein
MCHAGHDNVDHQGDHYRAKIKVRSSLPGENGLIDV